MIDVRLKQNIISYMVNMIVLLICETVERGSGSFFHSLFWTFAVLVMSYSTSSDTKWSHLVQKVCTC